MGSMCCSKGWMHFPVGVENLQPLQFVTFSPLCLRAFVFKKCCKHFHIVCFNFLCVLFSPSPFGEGWLSISCHKNPISCHFEKFRAIKIPLFVMRKNFPNHCIILVFNNYQNLMQFQFKKMMNWRA